MLIRAGAVLDGALDAACNAKNAHLIAAIRKEVREDFPGARNYEETSLMLQNAASVLDSYKGYGPIQNPSWFITEMDEATMEALVARGIDFTEANKYP